MPVGNKAMRDTLGTPYTAYRHGYAGQPIQLSCQIAGCAIILPAAQRSSATSSNVRTPSW